MKSCILNEGFIFKNILKFPEKIEEIIMHVRSYRYQSFELENLQYLKKLVILKEEFYGLFSFDKAIDLSNCVGLEELFFSYYFAQF